MKILKILGILLGAILLAAPGWTAECTGCTESRTVTPNSAILSVLVTSDGSACTCTLEDYVEDIKGLYIYTMEVVPGTGAVAPDAAFDIDLENAGGFHLLDTDDNVHTGPTWHPGDVTLGQLPIVRCADKAGCEGDLVLQMGDMGTAGDQATIHIYGVRIVK